LDETGDNQKNLTDYIKRFELWSEWVSLFFWRSHWQ